jgi:hypothetical protein
MKLKFYLSLAVAVLCSAFARAQDPGGSPSGSALGSNILNPNISVIGNMIGNAGPRSDASSNRAALSEVELGFQAVVDPYAKADVFVSFPEGEAAALEEGYVTLLTLPWELRARGGKFRVNFGRINAVHPHELPWVDSPLVYAAYLGEEGMNSTGGEISRVFAPFGVYTELSYSLLDDLGEEIPNSQGNTVTVNGWDSNGNPVTVPVSVHEDTTSPPRTLRNFANVARARFYGDITEAANVELGFSGALHEPEGLEQSRIAGADLTFRWKPLRQGLYRAFVWRTEGLYSSRKLVQETDLTGTVVRRPMRLDRKGLYSSVEFQAARRWRVGARGDYVEDPEAKDEHFRRDDGSEFAVNKSITRAVSPFVTFTLSEFNRLRVEYQYKRLPSQLNEHRAYFQWTFVLGPHGAHAF